MSTDLEIAQSASMLPIEEVAWKLSIGVEDLRRYGDFTAKITHDALLERFDRPSGALVLVTSVNPTPLGEGKTVTTIGLTQALNRLGRKATCTLREPSMGPVFGIKGGAAGGGKSQVLPMEEINLHFTGDIHAVSAAHNLCSAVLDNSLHHNDTHQIHSDRIGWPRVVDMNDRSLRMAAIGLGGYGNGVPRQDRFDITAASEVMAILALARDRDDLRRRLGSIIVAETRIGDPVTTEDLGVAGSMALLLREAFLPNLVQTLEGDPAFIHTGPFANIAHGNSSIISDRVALASADFVITEAGFGSDMGAEKFMHIKTPVSERPPDCIVLNVTVRSMKLHGGGFSTPPTRSPPTEEVESENVDAVRAGARTNLARHIAHLRSYGPPVVVSINTFASDSQSEIAALKEEAFIAGAKDAVLSEVHALGGEGGRELARAVVAGCEDHIADGRPFKPVVDQDADIAEKVHTLATRVYGASSINFSPAAERNLSRIRSWGFANVPVCMAKTQYSFSHDATLGGTPNGFELPINEFRLNAGAGFVVAVCGSMMTMPGLPSRPAAMDMDIDANGDLTGLFG